MSGLSFRSLIHFEFIFVYGVRKCSNFFLLHVAGPVFPAPFIEEAVFAPLYILASFVKNKLPIGAWVYFWAFHLFLWSIFLLLCQCPPLSHSHSSKRHTDAILLRRKKKKNLQLP